MKDFKIAILTNELKKVCKRFKLVAIILFVMPVYNTAQAQISFSVNISSQPLWAPVGYDYVEYYYLPTQDVYYNVQRREFVYLKGSNWVYASYLPSYYKVNLYSTYKVVINKPKPYLHHKMYKVKYAKYKGGGHKQVVIRDSNEPKYYVVKGHPKNKQSNGGGNDKGSKSNTYNGGKKMDQKNGSSKNNQEKSSGSGNSKPGGNNKQSGGKQKNGGR